MIMTKKYLTEKFEDLKKQFPRKELILSIHFSRYRVSSRASDGFRVFSQWLKGREIKAYMEGLADGFSPAKESESSPSHWLKTQVNNSDIPEIGDVVRVEQSADPIVLNNGYGKVGFIDGVRDGNIICVFNFTSPFHCEKYSSACGGPQKIININDLENTKEIRVTNCWNWGENMQGAGNGVPFNIISTIWKLKKVLK